MSRNVYKKCLQSLKCLPIARKRFGSSETLNTGSETRFHCTKSLPISCNDPVLIACLENEMKCNGSVARNASMGFFGSQCKVTMGRSTRNPRTGRLRRQTIRYYSHNRRSRGLSAKEISYAKRASELIPRERHRATRIATATLLDVLSNGDCDYNNGWSDGADDLFLGSECSFPW